MSQVIVNAIQERRILLFTYNGELRNVEPHCYGINTKGNAVLSGWQINKGWRIFLLTSMSGLSDKEGMFLSNRPGYNPDDKGMSKIIARL